jgi:hypothetical protein
MKDGGVMLDWHPPDGGPVITLSAVQWIALLREIRKLGKLP